MRGEVCACGGLIVVDDDADDEEIVTTIKTHNQTPLHQAWRARLEAEDSESRKRLDAYESRLDR